MEKFSRGIGFLLISLKMKMRDPRGVLVGLIDIMLWILMVSGVFSSNAPAQSRRGSILSVSHELHVDHGLPV